MQLPIYVYIMFASTIAAIAVLFKRPIPLYLKIFPFFLLITIAVEFVANWMNSRWGNSMPLFNFYLVFNICFFVFVLRDIISSPISRKLALFAVAAYFIFGLWNIFFYQGLYTWNSISHSLGCLLIVAFCIYYFLELFKKPKSTKLTDEPAFWIVSGLLFFYCVSFPFLGLNNLLNSAPPLLMRNLQWILTVLNILLYLLFTIAFLCRFRLKRPAI